MRQESGTLWRIRRAGGAVARRPAAPRVVPFYTLQYLTWALLALGGVLLVGWLLRALMRRRT